MAKTYSTEYAIGLRDEATQTIGKIQSEIRELNKQLKNVEIGSETFNQLKNQIQESEKVLAQAKEGIGSYGREQNKLTDFIKTQRQEQRQQNFLFNQGKDVIGSAAIALSLFSNSTGDSDKEMKKFSDSLNKGFITFQGLDFMLKSIPGPWGMAISIAGGLAAAIFSIGKESETAEEKLKKQREELEKLFKEYNEWSGKLKGDAESNKKASEAERNLLQVRVNMLQQIIDAQKAGQKELNIIIDDTKLSVSELAEMQTEASLRVNKSLKDNEEELKNLRSRLDAVTSASMQVDVIGNKLASGSMKELEERAKKIEEEISRLNPETEEYKNKLIELDRIQTQMRIIEMNRLDILKDYHGEFEKFNISLQNMLKNAKIETLPEFKFHLPKVGLIDISAPKNSLNELEVQMKAVESELKNLDLSSPEFKNLVKKLNELKIKFKESLEDPIEKYKNDFKNVTQYAIKSINLISQANEVSAQNELNSIEARKRAELNRIEKELANENLSKEEHDRLEKEKLEIEKKYDAEERRVKLQMWEADKEAKLIMATIDTASAVVEALPNVILAGIAAAMGAAQIAIIASQKPPSYHYGGIVPGSPNDEYLALVRGGETIRTEAQERLIQQAITYNQDYSNKATIVINFNAPTSDEVFVQNAVMKSLRKSGLTIDKLFVNRKNKFVIQ